MSKLNEQMFELLREQHKETMARFDKFEASHEEHMKEDREVHKLVERHTLYFNVAFLGLPVIVGALIKRLGFNT